MPDWLHSTPQKTPAELQRESNIERLRERQRQKDAQREQEQQERDQDGQGGRRRP
jgi:hypothetical protein